EVEPKISETSDLSEFDLEQLYQTSIQNQTNTITNNTNRLEQREIKLIEIIPFAGSNQDLRVNRAKACKLTRYSVAIYITPNLNNNIVTPTPTSSNSVEIIIEALTKYIKNLEKKIEKKLENNNLNDSQAESSKLPKAKKKRNPLQGPRFYKLTI
ncbi:21381_t:CDS:2, partial [Racocetra persica]